MGFFVDALGILAHRMSDDEQEMCPSSSETKCKVFSFHETILSFGEPGSLGMVGRVVKKNKLEGHVCCQMYRSGQIVRTKPPRSPQNVV